MNIFHLDASKCVHLSFCDADILVQHTVQYSWSEGGGGLQKWLLAAMRNRLHLAVAWNGFYAGEERLWKMNSQGRGGGRICVCYCEMETICCIYWTSPGIHYTVSGDNLSVFIRTTTFWMSRWIVLLNESGWGLGVGGLGGGMLR